MFQDSQKEGALEYADWRAEVEEYIKKGYKDSKIKHAMLFSLEGKARQNFWHCDEHGDLTPETNIYVLQCLHGLLRPQRTVVWAQVGCL